MINCSRVKETTLLKHGYQKLNNSSYQFRPTPPNHNILTYLATLPILYNSLNILTPLSYTSYSYVG